MSHIEFFYYIFYYVLGTQRSLYSLTVLFIKICVQLSVPSDRYASLKNRRNKKATKMLLILYLVFYIFPVLASYNGLKQYKLSIHDHDA